MSLLLRFAPYIAGVLFILGCGTYLYHKGDERGAARVQVRFDKFVAASDALVANAKADNEAKRIKAENDNAVALKDYQSRLATANAFGNSIAGRLREYLAKASSSPVPPASAGSPVAGAGPAPSDTGIAETIGAVATECRDNADQLDALIGELKAQLRPVNP